MVTDEVLTAFLLDCPAVTNGNLENIVADFLEDYDDPRTVIFRAFATGDQAPVPRLMGTTFLHANLTEQCSVMISALTIGNKRLRPYRSDQVEVALHWFHNKHHVQEWAVLLTPWQCRAMVTCFLPGDILQAKKRFDVWRQLNLVAADFLDSFGILNS